VVRRPVSSPWYARAQAGTYQPNLLASFCIFASAVIAWPEAELPVWLRRVTQAALLLTVGLTISRGIFAFILAAAIRSARTKTQRRLVGCYAAGCVALIAALTVWNLPSIRRAHLIRA
jgi:multisubunit Na+/H+ antiporter MnhG subunit